MLTNPPRRAITIPGNALRCNDASLSGRKNDSADKLERAIAEVLAEGKNVAYDLKLGRADSTAVGTSQAADAVIEKLGKSDR